jgi:hypothetical protein
MPRNTIVIGGTIVELASDEGRAFLVDAVRAAEGLITDQDLVELHGVSPPELQTLAKDLHFARALRAERDRRVRSGTAAREAASKFFVKSPKILDEIQSDGNANARHKIESIRELRQIAAPENASGPSQSDRFVITINIGDESLHYNKSIAIDPNDGVPEEPKLVNKRPKLPKRQPKLIISNEQDDER